MLGCLRSCVGKVVLLVLLAAVAFAGWRWGPELVPRVERWLGWEGEVQAEASPELAEATLDRYEAFRSGELGDGEELMLGEAELESILTYSLPGLLPRGVRDPGVEMKGERIVLSARVAVDRFPNLPDLEAVVGILPDTVPLTLEGSLIPVDRTQAGLVVHEITASRIPVPRRMIPRILRALGRTDRAGLPADALQVPLPEGLRSAYILRDSLVLVADRD